MISKAPRTRQQLNPYERLALDVADTAPPWFERTRTKAFNAFVELGIPTARHEDWRFTNIAPIRDTAFRRPAEAVAVTGDQIRPLLIDDLDCIRVVFVNGRYSAELSDLTALPEGVRVLSLAEAFSESLEPLERHLGRHANINEKAFTALNTALIEDGLYVHVPRGRTVEKPIYVLNLTVPEAEPILVSPRNLIVVDDGAAATVIEDYAALLDGVYFNNAVTEVVVGRNAEAGHYYLERESERAYNMNSLYVHQDRDSRFTSHSMLFGGAIVRNNVQPVLDGENAWSVLNGLYVPSGDQAIDSHMRVEHASPHCQSRQYYKGVMHDRGRGVFRGRIVVHPDAQKTDAVQSNQNLLMSDRAGANTDPQLEIFADDVKCTHGATIGQIDQDQVFYLESRGIDADAARAMIIYAFASESIERIALEPVRNLMQKMLFEKMPEARVLEAAV